MSELGRADHRALHGEQGRGEDAHQGDVRRIGQARHQANGISPGYFGTELNQALMADEKFSAWVCARTPQARWGKVEELQGAAIFLASDASSFVNGHILFVDGGMTAVV